MSLVEDGGVVRRRGSGVKTVCEALSDVFEHGKRCPEQKYWKGS